MYGSEEHPAEWDGNVLGGGKVSQRFWEYHVAAEMLDLERDSVVLDIGGGKGFFAKLVGPFVRKVIVLDKPQEPEIPDLPNVEFVLEHASSEKLPAIMARGITHVSCISVFEHVPEDIRVGIMKSINDHFQGKTFVTTFEFHPRICFFEHQLTTRTMNRMMSQMTGYYLERVESSPIRCENAFGRMFAPFRSHDQQFVGMWFPLAMKFSKV